MEEVPQQSFNELRSVVDRLDSLAERTEKMIMVGLNEQNTADLRPVNEDVPNPIPPYGESASLRIRDVHIRQLNAGYVVDVGCHNFAITSKTDLIEYLAAYIKDPKSTEEKWFKGELFQE